MVAVKGLGYGLREIVGAEVRRKHRRPSNGLQTNPLQPRCQNEGHHDDKFDGTFLQGLYDYQFDLSRKLNRNKSLISTCEYYQITEVYP
jgi:hypothetical protein